ncbi:MAG: thioredoxin family protein [bacterium]|nr:thioredoxin family protein [bacterium]
MEIKLFGKEMCHGCKVAKERILSLIEHVDPKVKFNYYDLDTVDGLAEGSFYEVQHVPTILILNNDKVLWRFDGELPSDFEKYLKWK